jgi:aldehyde:ferredoxin oxidoreductase
VPGQDRVRVEYESLFALGSLCGVSDAESVLQAVRRCDELGIDTISAGGTIAFAMECVQRGLLDEPWLRFSDAAAVLAALELTARRAGLGNLLADGSRAMARVVGGSAPSFAPHVKGLELPGYEPRAMQTLALGLAVNSRGADHNRSGAAEADFSDRTDRRHLTREAARLAIETEDKAALFDSLILCRFLRGTLRDVYAEAADMLSAVTGWDVTAAELRQTSQRIVTAKKLFNIHAGWTPDEDTLPTRFLEEPLPDDPAARLTETQLRDAVRAYNRQRGWSARGWLDQPLLQRMQLSESSVVRATAQTPPGH